ncbi:hypothetical protein ABI_39730 [Asticcacaulis biprosthecium C19]|uniref:Uncharacterized protein n=1 Tax=Asticcacaulis biprosthecium C19 TaxID=715226 RepID=F4QS36_9CAUL|nr:hypothetical protein [Asticcacaulis biprosthecium]EGF89556.1 hypothetical protein ABI_39730 [Asticcacaulis biprosthecium C19]
MIMKTLALSGALALAICAGSATSALAQTDYSGLCVAVGVEIGLRGEAAQEALDQAVDAAGSDVSDADQAEIDALQELLDNLETISASMDVLYDAEATPPTGPEMDTVGEAGIEELLDAANECVDAA